MMSLSVLLLIVLAPLCAAIVVGIFGTKMGGNLLGRTASRDLSFGEPLDWDMIA